MEHYRNKFPVVHFYMASDDKAWCRQHFTGKDTTILPYTLVPSVELSILAQCRHVITSVGTFGWWAAYLSLQEEAIYPTSSYKQGYWTETRLQHYLPATWKGL